MTQSSPNLIFHADNARGGVVPGPRHLHLGQRHHRVAHRPRARCHLHRPVGDRHADDGAVGGGHRRADGDGVTVPGQGAPGRPDAPPSLSTGPGPGREDHGRQDDDRRPRSRPSSPGSDRTPTTRPTSLPSPRDRTPSTSSSSATAPGSASRSPRRWRSCCDRSASPPARPSGTCPVPTTRSPTSTRSRPRTPTPGSRCGSPGYGWQSFDPTAVVPLANPSPGATLLHDAARRPAATAARPPGCGRWPWPPSVALVIRWRRRRPATWAERRGPPHRACRPAGGTVATAGRDPDRVRVGPRRQAGDRSGTWSRVGLVGRGERLRTARTIGRRTSTGGASCSRTVRPDRLTTGAPAGTGRLTPAAVPVPRRDSPAPPPEGGSPSADGAG